ncbi:MAG: hypothetical protein JXQ26_07105 [Tissierellales bacterium]|nr:hypothetical protein [Candidatus Dojkabacteria bacterium]MBN2827740.1 hypothetical protein [Tissierellales bacterium]
MTNFNQTTIQAYTTALIAGTLAELKSVAKIKHPLLTGELRESFVVNLLSHFLPERYGVGSGVIVNPLGIESTQWDIIIYDKNIIPPFIFEMDRGVFPAETVLAVIEVKSKLTLQELRKTNANSKRLITRIYDDKFFAYKEPYKPIIGALGLYGYSAKVLLNQDGAKWVGSNLEYLNLFCLCEKYCWLKVESEWKYSFATETYEEVKRFLFSLLDNIRTKAVEKDTYYSLQHRDWYSLYARDQLEVRQFLEGDQGWPLLCTHFD